MSEIVITGMGVVSPIGIGSEAYWDSLLAGRSGVMPLSSPEASVLPNRIGGEVTDFEAKKFVKPRKSLKVMSREIQLSFGAADMAFENAGFAAEAIDPERLGVVFGADMIYCEADGVEPVYKACIKDGKFDFSLWGKSFPDEMYPLWMLRFLPNMPACHIGIYHDARGPNNSIVTLEASGLLALAEGARVIERGQADVMIVGGGSTRLHHMPIISRTGKRISLRNDDPTRASRPFDSDRDGLVHGEGAAAFVLERRDRAQRRGAKILARIMASSSTFGPKDMDAPPRLSAIRNSITGVLKSSGLSPEQIGHVNASGASTREQDPVEAQAIREVLGDVPVTAPTSYFGAIGAGAGAVEMVASVLSLQHGLTPPTLNYETPDPECPVNVVQGEAQPLASPNVMLLNHTMMGQAVGAILTREE